MVESSKQRVLITGVTGFIGSQVCLEYLKDGTYLVRGTVRDTKNEKRMAPLKKALGDLFAKVEFVEADLLNPQSMEKAVEGCDFVVHTASPATINKPKHEDNLIKPAVEGTLAILKACDRYRVKRLVITSSIAAIYTQFPENMKETYSEADWSEVSLVSAYEKSKILAERAAWEFVHDLPLERRFELVTLQPSLVLGPAAVPATDSSAEFIRRLLVSAYPGMPKTMIGVVDVRDVSLAHLRAIKYPEAANKRILINADSLWITDIARVLAKEYPDLNVTTREFGYCPIKMMSYIDNSVGMILPIWAKVIKFDNSLSRNVLGISYQDTTDSIIAMAQSHIDHGIVKRKNQK